MCCYGHDEVVSLAIEEDLCSLVLELREPGPMRFHVETPRTALDIRNVWQGGQEGGESEVCS